MVNLEELINVKSDDKNIIVNIPVDLLIHAQKYRDEPRNITDTNGMIEYFKKYFIGFNRRQYEDMGSDLEILIDDFFGVYVHRKIIKNREYIYFVAKMTFDGKDLWIGQYKTEIEAAIAYDVVCWEKYHDINHLNFPENYIERIII